MELDQRIINSNKSFPRHPDTFNSAYTRSDLFRKFGNVAHPGKIFIDVYVAGKICSQLESVFNLD